MGRKTYKKMKRRKWISLFLAIGLFVESLNLGMASGLQEVQAAAETVHLQGDETTIDLEALPLEEAFQKAVENRNTADPKKLEGTELSKEELKSAFELLPLGKAEAEQLEKAGLRIYFYGEKDAKGTDEQGGYSITGSETLKIVLLNESSQKKTVLLKNGEAKEKMVLPGREEKSDPSVQKEEIVSESSVDNEPSEKEQPDGKAAKTEETQRIPGKIQSYELGSITRTVYLAKVDGASVDVSVRKDAFDRKVSLKAEKLEWPKAPSDEKGSFSAEKLEALNQIGSGPENSFIYDIRFEDADGNEIEPASKADVRIDMDAEVLRSKNADPATLEITHLKETNETDHPVIPEKVAQAEERSKSIRAIKGSREVPITEAAVEAPGNPERKAISADTKKIVADFTVGSFSNFVITWQGWSGAELRVLNEVDKGDGIPDPVPMAGVTEPGSYQIPARSGSYAEYAEVVRDIVRRTRLDVDRDGMTDYRFDHAYVVRADTGEKIRVSMVKIDTNKTRWGYYFYDTTDRQANPIYGTWDGAHGADRYQYDLHLVWRSVRRPREIQTEDTGKDIRISIRDYNGDPNNDNVGINRNHNFKFTFGGDRPDINGFPVNDYTQYSAGSGQKPYQKIVSDILGEDGYPILRADQTSLSYLFGGANVNTGIAFARDRMNHLFYKNSEGYLEYDSAKHFATLFDDDSEVFNGYLLKDNNFKVYEIPLEYQKNVTPATAQFQPLSDINEYGKLITPRNLWGGMKIEANVVQPEGGQADGKDMVFNFSGDDDLWVFIDGVKILDLGGIHDKISGSINFATGEITGAGESQGTIAQRVRAIRGSLPDKDLGLHGNTYADYTNHDMRIFYFERGDGESNLKVTMNLVTIPQNELYLGKKVVNEDRVPLPSDTKYKFLVEFKKSNETAYTPYTGAYQIWQGTVGNPKDPHNVKIKDVSAAENTNGIVDLADGQYIKIAEGSNLVPSDRYRITEFAEGPAARYSQMYDVTTSVSSVTARTLTGDKGETLYGDMIQDKRLGDAPLVVFSNKIQAANLGDLVIDKEMKAGHQADPDQRFHFDVSIGGTPYSGEYEVYQANETNYSVPKTTKQTMTNGKLTLKAGQKAVIRKLLWRIPYSVKEDTSLLGTEYASPAYYRTSEYTAPDYSKDRGGTVPVEELPAVKTVQEDNVLLTPPGEGQPDITNGLNRSGSVVGIMPSGKKGRVLVKVENSKARIPVPTGLDLHIWQYVWMLFAGMALFVIFLVRRKGSRV